MFKFAISLPEIYNKYDQLNPPVSKEEFINIVNEINKYDPDKVNNQLTTQYTIQYFKYNKPLDQIIQELVNKSKSKKHDPLKDLENKYKINVNKILSRLNNDNKKYIDIACKWIAEGNPEDDVISTINAFEKSKSKLSKQNIKLFTYEELHDEILNIPEDFQDDSLEDLVPLFNINNFTVYRLDNKNQAIKTGNDIPWDYIKKNIPNFRSRWCITLNNHNYFNNYSMSNTFFYLVDDSSKDWNDPFKRFVIHFVKDVNGNIINTIVTSLENREYDIEDFPQYSEIYERIKPDVIEQPETILSKIINNRGTQQEFNKYLLSLEKNPNQSEEETLYDLKDLFSQINSNYFNESVYNIFKNKKDFISEYIVEYTLLVCRDIQASDKEYLKLSKKYNIPLKLLNNTATEEEKLYFIKENVNYISYIKDPSEKLQLEVVKIDAAIIKNIQNPTEKVQLLVINEEPVLISNIKNPTEKVKKRAIEGNPYAIQYIENPSEELQLLAVILRPDVIKYIKDPSEEVQLEAVKKDGNSIAFIKDPSEKVKLEAVKQNGLSILYINNPSEELKLEAVKKHGNSIAYIKNPSEEMELLAVKQNGYSIKHIIDPSEILQLEAVKQNVNSIYYIERPTQNVINLYEHLTRQKYRAANINFKNILKLSKLYLSYIK